MLEHLSLGRNRIAELPEDGFKGLDRVSEVEVRGNPLRRIHPNAFRHLPKLKQL